MLATFVDAVKILQPGLAALDRGLRSNLKDVSIPLCAFSAWLLLDPVFHRALFVIREMLSDGLSGFGLFNLPKR